MSYEVALAKVEDNLANVCLLNEQSRATRDAVGSANRALAQSRCRAGETSYLNVIDAQRSLLLVQRLDT